MTYMREEDNEDQEVHERVRGDAQLELSLSPIVYTFILNYLYNLHQNIIQDEFLEVKKMEGLNNYAAPMCGEISCSKMAGTDIYQFYDLVIYAKVTYGEGEYNFTFKHTLLRVYEEKETLEMNLFWVQRTSGAAGNMWKLVDYLQTKAYAKSMLLHKVLNYVSQEKPSSGILQNLEIMDSPFHNLGSLYIPKAKMDQVQRFIFSINNYGENMYSLRYLLSGKPGTGKTQIIRAIISAVRDKATVLFCKGGKLPLTDIFSFCKKFTPCLLVIDDVDFIAGNRGENFNRDQLGTFLQILDGIMPNNVFLLASTNDKSLVDAAASRPGRFDMILDISEIDSAHYLSLVNRETTNTSIINFFNEEVLNDLKQKKVTGAFIVSLVKQLKSAINMRGELSKDDFLEYLNLSHDGFYSSNDETVIKSFGFN